jgi:hypothetical protein
MGCHIEKELGYGITFMDGSLKICVRKTVET